MPYNTGNAVGSVDPRDLIDNAEHLDDAVNGESPIWTDRLGRVRVSMFGAEANASIITQRAEAAAATSVAAVSSTSASVAAAAAEAVKSKASADTAASIVTGGTASLEPLPGLMPLADGEGKIDLRWLGVDVAARINMSAVQLNHIGVPGAVGFGVGICPAPPPGMAMLAGTLAIGSDEYGNYQYEDGSVMVWIPAFFYRYGSAESVAYADYDVNSADVLPRSAYPTVLAAAVAGFALHRAFYDGGIEQPGVFVDKYQCSNNGGIASSVKMGAPLTSSSAHNPFSGLNGSPANNFSGSIPAAKTRGADFFPTSPFIQKALALLSLAHGQAATSTAACAWYSDGGTTNFPKGCNNNALGDVNDSEISYESTGHETYPDCGKTGSGKPFERTTHNGQACGVADLNGNVWEINPGLTVLDGEYYILSPDARMADLTEGVTLATDAWGPAGVAANYLLLGASHGSLGSGPGESRAIGSANQVLSGATEGLDWAAAGAGIPQLDGTGGTNLFGNDRLYDNNPEHMCTAAGGHWHYSTTSGVWALYCYLSRTNSNYAYGFRAALYLV